MAETTGITTHFKRIARHTLIYGLGFASTSALALILTPIYTSELAPEDYGRLRLVNITLQLLTIFASLGVVEAFYRFYYQRKGSGEDKSFTSTALLILFLSLLVCAAVVLIAAEPLSTLLLDDSAYAIYFRIAAGTLVASGLATFLLAILRVRERSGSYALVSVLRLALALGLNILLVVELGCGISGVLSASLASSLFVVFILSPMLVKNVSGFAAGSAREILRFGLPLVPASLASMIIASSSLYFLKAASSLEEVGIFSLALQFGSAINILVVTPFDMTWAPMKYKLVDDPQADRIYANVLTYFLAIALMACIGLAAIIGDVMELIIDDRYSQSALYVGAIGACFAIFGAYRVFCFGIDIRNKTHLRAGIIVVSMLLCLGANALLVPRFGAWGAVASLLAAYSFMAIAAYIASQKLYPVSYQLGRIAKLVLAAAFTFYMAYIIDTDSNLLNLAAKTLVVLMYPVVLLPLGFYRREEKAGLSRILASLLSRPER